MTHHQQQKHSPEIQYMLRIESIVDITLLHKQTLFSYYFIQQGIKQFADHNIS